ncbi:MAG: Hsp20/alpha crystallin family protein [Elusimicrobiota bacterium]|nr:Hsp20/alpha crystallin family protein [Elusimicrobiota bacterium]
MGTKKTPPYPGVPAGLPVREALETLEQVLAAGWYPARHLLMSRLASPQGPGLTAWVPEADVEEGPAEVVVSFALPGVEKADIRLECDEDTLTVSGRRRDEDDAPEGARREQSRGAFLRRVVLPAAVKPAGARATHRNGVLRVVLPRAKAGFGRSIKVE